jgi:hypothetical protein
LPSVLQIGGKRQESEAGHRTHEQWDDGFLLNDRDGALFEAFAAVPEAKLYLFRDADPSAEEMTRGLCGVARAQVGRVVRSVRIWESPHQYAEYRPDGTADRMPEESRRRRNWGWCCLPRARLHDRRDNAYERAVHPDPVP